jgi:hypothetical protein
MKYDSIRSAAKALNCHHRTLQNCMKKNGLYKNFLIIKLIKIDSL